MRRALRQKCVVIVLVCCGSRSTLAQELGLYTGPLTGAGQRSYSWAIDYQEGFGRYLAGSVTWLNEGHIPGHHRDGHLIQLWARVPLDRRRLVLAIGAGPYRYFDTVQADQDGTYANTHGWGMVYSARATWYSSDRWTANLQLNRVQIPGGPSTSSILAGIGYQLDAPDAPGPRDWALPRQGTVTHNELTVMVGETILNSLESQTSAAETIEYRRGIGRFADATVGYLHEGNRIAARRDGLTAQLWLTRAFLNQRLTLGVGAGAYAAIHHGENADSRTTGDGILSGIVSLSAAYRLTRHWAARATWNRVVTRYSRDTDVLLGGIGYRF